jgi:WD40 repeat protein/energy-coupling factor transporter ATP-binding protein EcfA2
MKRYALVIGIAEYSGLNKLEKPPVDAEAVARVLEKYGDFQEVKRLPENWISRDCCEVGSTELTGKMLTESLRNFLLEQTVNSEALIYFSGHGISVFNSLDEENEGFLATSDCKVAFKGKQIISQQNGISLRSLNKLIDKSKVSSLVVILDCCHAGYFLDKDLVNKTLTTFNSAERDYYLMAACRRGEQAWEGEEYSIFTEALLKGLVAEKAGSDGQIICDQLFAFIDGELKGKGQEPIRMGWGRSITLVKYQKQAPVVVVPSEECPYQGLKAFEEGQKQFFFGRERVINQIRHKLNQKPFVPIIGASGSGKSSVVLAGLIPLLKEQESGWKVLKTIKPGIEPLTELRAAFKEFFPGVAKEKQLYSLIKNEQQGLVKLIECLPSSERFLLVIDQFEEVFTLCPREEGKENKKDKEDRQRFIELITQVAEIADSRLAIVTTMRADFLEPCLEYESLRKLIQNQAIFMPPLLGGDLEKAITKPAELQGYHLEDGLLGTILEEKVKVSLPLLQFALTELWEKRDCQKHQLTLEQYEVMGKAIGSLNRHAHKVYSYKDFWEDAPKDARTQQEQEWIKRIFLRLVRTGEEEKDTRQRQPRGKLLCIAGENLEVREALNEVIDELVQGRLLVTGEAEQKPDIADAVSDAKMVDLAHEALMEGWTKFAQWRQEDRELRRLSDRIEDAWREWEKQPKDEYLMMGGLLNQVRLEWENLAVYLEPNLKEFYRRSNAHEQDRIAQLQQALTESRIREQAARVLNILPFQPLDALVLAIQTMGLNLDHLPGGKILTPVQGSLNEAMKIARVSNTFQGHESSVNSVAFSPDGQFIVSGSWDNTLLLWDIQGNRVGQPFQGHESSVISVAFSPDSKLIVSGSDDNTVRLWDIDGNSVGQPFRGHSASVNSVAFSPDGRLIVSVSSDNTIRMWDFDGKRVGQPFRGHENSVNSVAFSPDGQFIVSGSSDNTVRLWDIQGNSVGQPFQGHENSVNSVAFSPDGQFIVSGSSDNTIRMWDIQGNMVAQPFLGHGYSVTSVAFSPDGQFIVSGSRDNTIGMWDLDGKRVGQPFHGHENCINSVAFSPDGQFIVSGSSDNTIRMWDIQGNMVAQPFLGHGYSVTSVAFSPDGKLIVSGSRDNTVLLWDLQGNMVAQPFLGHGYSVTSVAFSSDGKLIVSGSRDKTVRLWDLQGNMVAQPFLGHENEVNSVAFSPDGKLIVSVSTDNTVLLWDIQGNPISQPFWGGHWNSFSSVAFSPDGQFIVSGSWDNTIRMWDIQGKRGGSWDNTIRVWDIQGKRVGQPFWGGHWNSFSSVAFSPDGQFIVSGSSDNTIRMWDIQGNPIGQPFLGHEDKVNSVAFSPDGQFIVSGSWDKTVRLWDIQGNPIGQSFLGHEDEVNSVAFSPDGKLIVSGSLDSTVRLWRGGWQAWLEVCCNRLRYHPVFKNPQTDVEKQACETCQKYVWSRE